MKKILIALAMTGLVHYGATAQTKNATDYGQNYVTCGDKAPSTSSPAAQNFAVCKVPQAEAGTQQGSSLSMMNTYVHLGYRHNGHISRIKVSYEDPMAPYKGEASVQNDGVKANEVRNVNYQTNEVLPPVDGNNSK